MPATGGAPEQLTHGGGGPALESTDGKYVYYFKYSGQGDEPAPLFRMSAKGGAEVQILPQVASWSSFGIGAKAVYFTPNQRTVQRLELSTGKVDTLTRLAQEADSLCVSPDGAFVVWSQTDSEVRELTLVEGFR